MKVAHSILGMFTCGFHGTYGRQNVFDSGREETWLPVYIVQMLGPVSFEVKLTDGQIV